MIFLGQGDKSQFKSLYISTSNTHVKYLFQCYNPLVISIIVQGMEEMKTNLIRMIKKKSTDLTTEPSFGEGEWQLFSLTERMK